MTKLEQYAWMGGDQEIVDGIYHGMPIGVYHGRALEYDSSTKSRELLKSPRHYQVYEYEEPTGFDFANMAKGNHFDFGNAFELALMDMRAYIDNVFIYDPLARPEPNKGFQGKVTPNVLWRVEQQEAAKGFQYAITKYGKESAEVIEQMMGSCYRDKAIKALINKMSIDTSIFWTDSETGIKCKTRPDTLSGKKKSLSNIKTTLNGSPRAFSSTVTRLNYPVQAAMEIDGVLSSGLMEKVDAYFWLVVEKEPPFNASIYELDGHDREKAFDLLNQTRHLLKRMREEYGEKPWPGYTIQQKIKEKYGILDVYIPDSYWNKH